MEELRDYLFNNIEVTKNITGELICMYGCLDHLEYYYMEDFDDVLQGYTPTEIANRMFYGEFNPNDDYFRFDAYGNLESLDNWELDKEHKDYIDEIIENLIQYKDDMNSIDSKLKELLENI